MTITVCAACLTAGCFQGLFFCEDHKTADVAEMTRDELEKLGLEDSSYWDDPEDILADALTSELGS
jgi:hypothetical protein